MTVAPTPCPTRTPPHGIMAGFAPIVRYLREIGVFFVRPIAIIRHYRLGNLRYDLLAGLTVAIMTLPQAIAFALIAELPPRVGLYSAIVGAIVGGLWGSSSQLQTGPTNTTSLLILSVLLPIASPGTPEYLAAAGMMALLVGIFRLLMGLARLGILVNFVAESVIVGFTAGAGVLILINQLRNLLRLNIPSAPNLWTTVPLIARNLIDAHWPSALIGTGTIVLVAVLKKANRKLPGPLIGMAVASLIVALFGLDGLGVRVVGELPRGFPPLTRLPILDTQLLGQLLSGSLAVAAIGLVEAMSIARSIAAQTGQRLDSNQEFVGQGLANIACALFSGYAASGSFTRSAVSHEAGARTALASFFGGLIVLLIMLLFAPLAAYVPQASLAGVLILTAYGLINLTKIARVWRSTSGDRLIMIATLIATLALPLQFAVLTGIALSVGHYLIRTSKPRVHTVLPDAQFRHLAHRSGQPACPQLGIIEVLGDMYFGAINHIEEAVLDNVKSNPGQRLLLLRLQSVEHCDISGIQMLESIMRSYRARGGDIYLTRVRHRVFQVMQASGFVDQLGADHFLDQDGFINYLFYHVIDPAICIYECPQRVFQECQNLPKFNYPHAVRIDVHLPNGGVPTVTPQTLWQNLHEKRLQQIVDVREPREFQRGHIPEAQHIPLPVLPNHLDDIARDRPVVMVCQGGRRSERATALLLEKGFDNARMLQGGMVAWRQEKLLEAVE